MNATTITLNYTETSRFLGPLLNTGNNREVPAPHQKILYTNEAIIYGIKARDKDVINFVYKQSFAQVKYFVTMNSGDKMDAEDLFQDAIVLIYKIIDSKDLKLTCAFSSYIYSICRNLWFQRLSKVKDYTRLNDNQATIDPIEDEQEYQDHLVESEKYRLFIKYFNKLNNNEQTVLKLYMSKIQGKEIASIMGYKSVKYAKYRKYTIKEKLKNMIVNDVQYPNVYSTVI